jgi:two-component system response regulator GlrR
MPARTASAVEQPSRPPEKPATSAPPARILLVEDDEDMRRLLSAVLRKAGFLVHEGPDGMSLLRSLSSAADDRPLFDVIISDVQMPDFTAIEVLDALRVRNVATPVVLISAHVDGALRVEAESLGVVALLSKPLDGPALLRAINQALVIAASPPAPK